jgi:hypothetical protein
MIADNTFGSFISEDVANNLRDVGEEFDEGVSQNNLTDSLGRKYERALRAYERELYNCPYSPTGIMVQPSAHDSMMMEKMREELARVQKEHSRILDQFGGVLSLD